MTITFNTNLAALGAQRNIGIASNAASSSLAKLSSGSRVPQAKDDAAALAVGSKLKAEVTGLTQASNNAAQAISLLQIADGALATMGDMLQRMKALATQSSSGQLGASERQLLDQEYQNLLGEVGRISATANFNGTTLLAGSTTVTSNVNGLTSFSATNDTAATNLLGEGFQSIDFAENFGNGAIKIEYNGTTRDMTVTNLATDATQTVRLAAGAIAAGSSETVNFSEIGVSFTLNNQFDKAVSIAASNTASVTAAASATAYTVTNNIAGGGALVFGTGADAPRITAVSFNDTEAGPFGSARTFGEALTGVTLTISGTSETAVTFQDVTIAGRTFSQTSAAQSFGTTGDKDFTFADGNGNSFTVRLNVGTAADAALTGGGTVALTAGTTGGRIQNDGAAGADSRPKVTGITVGDPAYDFGALDNARLTINAATAASSTLTLGGFSATGVNLASTGLRTVSLADADGNQIDVQFNVTQAFANGDVGQIVLGDIGQIAAANSATTATTTFSFKVGTGVTANDNIAVTINSATTTALGIAGGDILTSGNADTAITALNTAIDRVSSRRADIGANQSRLEFASASINVAIENTTAATSALLDVDVSSEITTFTSKQVLLQAGVSLLSQANQQPALLLRLLQ